MNKRGGPNRERGYSLAEVLIAAAIAAGVLSSVATALGGATRLSARGAEKAQVLGEAELIGARARAQMSDDEILEGLSGWRIERAPFHDAQIDAPHPGFEVAAASFGENDAFTFEILVRRAEATP